MDSGLDKKMPESEKLLAVLKEAKALDATDIHLAPKAPVMVRVNGALVPLNEEPFLPEESKTILRTMLDEEQQHVLKERGEIDFAYSVPGFSRVRISAFRQRGTYAMAIRILPGDIPNPEDIGLTDSMIDLTNCKDGLVLVTGKAGSGRSTTVASLLNLIAKGSTRHIITIEDPIEYLYNHGNSIVLQREVGYDCISYAEGLRSALRQDPDVVYVGEICDAETFLLALRGAESGHLVFTTLPTTGVATTIGRLVGFFPPHEKEQVLYRLSCVLRGVITRQLVPVQNETAREPAFEVLLRNPEITECVRSGKFFQLTSLLSEYRSEGMCSMDDSLYGLFMRGLITPDEAVGYSADMVAMEKRVRLF